MNALPTGGSIRPIIRWGEPVMHRPCSPVEAFDDDLRALVADMVATMHAADGVGLAANQVGVDLAVFVFDCPAEEGRGSVSGVVCNPTLTLPEGHERSLVVSDEGCLSLPGAFVECARLEYAEVNGLDEAGAPVSYAGSSLLARCLQHETDHLHGIVFGDKVPTKLRKRLYKEAAQLADEFPAGWPAVSA
ncbi:MAG: peptide deformylase [Nocardioidaceae bacterium]|nr:peptide deformylase [Nocardioidaceae bacterium]